MILPNVAVSHAVTDIKELFNSKLEALKSRVKALKERLSELENSSVAKGSKQSQVQMTSELTTELQAMQSHHGMPCRQTDLSQQHRHQYCVRLLQIGSLVSFLHCILQSSSVLLLFG